MIHYFHYDVVLSIKDQPVLNDSKWWRCYMFHPGPLSTIRNHHLSIMMDIQSTTNSQPVIIDHYQPLLITLFNHHHQYSWPLDYYSNHHYESPLLSTLINRCSHSQPFFFTNRLTSTTVAEQPWFTRLRNRCKSALPNGYREQPSGGNEVYSCFQEYQPIIQQVPLRNQVELMLFSINWLAQISG